MGDLPERIWADKDGRWTLFDASEFRRDPCGEYISADIAAAREADLRAEVERLRNDAALKKAECDGLGSLLLSVQQDCIAERKRADKAEAEAARLRALLDDAEKALEFYSCKDGCNDCSSNERDLIGCGWTARATLAKIGDQ